MLQYALSNSSEGLAESVVKWAVISSDGSFAKTLYNFFVSEIHSRVFVAGEEPCAASDSWFRFTEL
jgi:hypothetical protein